MEQREYYLLKYRLDGDDRYLLWYDGDPDGVVVDHEQRVLSFANATLLRRWADGNGLSVSDEAPVLHDLDSAREWSSSSPPDPNHVDCVAILHAWNLFIDVRSSVEQRNVIRDDPENNDVYDKLFWGNNLPALTPEGKSYVPIWSDAEAIRLAAVLNDGLRFFRAHLRHLDPE